MYLIDTSVIIDILKGTVNAKTELYGRIVDNGISYGISVFTCFEVLQGIKEDKTFEEVKRALATITHYHLKSSESYEAAATAYRRCRRSGVTPRSAVDLLIAQTALENKLILLHNDRDFDLMARCIEELVVA
ncbi:MAG: PIN domain-containing protein [Coriobacteriales bacterium]|jgi:predicted nucleic acid-binding protein|nr:PIN domain-containing protein [Coriobacteriales bacterium]